MYEKCSKSLIIKETNFKRHYNFILSPLEWSSSRRQKSGATDPERNARRRSLCTLLEGCELVQPLQKLDKESF